MEVSLYLCRSSIMNSGMVLANVEPEGDKHDNKMLSYLATSTQLLHAA